ncbi:MAG: N-ethylammeline chlorohydrolase [Pseudorhodobacter sp. PARRP1]|nr:MAG: N-ethylammeline chlorohydrolase [Pseudorhodobacter sp. PARRP1]
MSVFHDLKLGEHPKGRTALTADWVLGHAEGGHCLIPKGEIVFEAGRILHVGQRFEGEVARRIHLGPALISPGLIDLDALSDLDTTVLSIDNNPGWAKGRVWPRSYVERGPYEMYSPDELAFQKRYAFAQLLLNGITTAAPIASLFYRAWGETTAEFTTAAEAAGEMGLRVYLSPAYRAGGMVLDAPGQITPLFDETRGMAGLDDAVAFISAHQGRHNGLINGLLAPDRVETCTAPLLKRTMDAARDLGCRVRLHMAQGAMEVQTVHALHGTTAPEWLASEGLLNDRILAPHATNATETDLNHYAHHGVSVIHCPLVSARGGSILRSFGGLRARGINIAMGTDTAPADMLLNLLTGLMTARIADPQAPHQQSADFWDAATLGGARALGRNDIGCLKPNALADIAIFRLDDAVMTPAIDPITTLIAGGSGKVTQATFVGGRLSMCEGRVAGIDLLTAQTRAQGQFDGLLAKYPERSWQHPPVAELFTPSYPIRQEAAL